MGSFLENDTEKDAKGHLTDASSTTKVKPTPKLQNVSLEEAASYFSYLTVEAFFVVYQDMHIESYVPIPSPDDIHSGVLVKCQNKKEYSNIFTTTRTKPWKSVENKEQWVNKVEKDYGNKVAKFSKISI